MARRVDPILKELTAGYKTLKKQTAKDAKSARVAELIAKFSSSALDFLSSCQRIPLISKAPGKTYFSFAKAGKKPKLSRAVNVSLFDPSSAKHLNHLKCFYG